MWFDYCSLDYDELSIKLRQKYSSYPYINVYEQNNEIIVEIFNYDEKFNNEIKNIVGSVVAKKDAVVDLIYVYSGTSNVYKNKYVKKGDVLISENLTSDTKVSAKGLIMGYTYELVNLSINKENKSYTITNNENVYHKVNFCSLGFNVGKGKNESFEFCDYEYEKIFNIYNLLTIERVTEKEKKLQENTIDMETAKAEALRILQERFDQNKSNEKEMICKKEIYKIVETEVEFNISVIMKCYESIGVFLES